MSSARDFHVLQNVSYNSGHVNSFAQDYALNDILFGNYENNINKYESVHIEYADNRSSTNTIIEILQHYSAEGHIEEDYQNEDFVDSKSPADQTIQYFDNNLNRQENQEHYGLTSTAAYSHDFNSHNQIIQQSDGDESIEQGKLPNNEIDVPELNVPQGQDINDNMVSNDSVTALQECDSPKSNEPTRNDIQKSTSRLITVLPDASHLDSESEIKRIRSLPIMEKSKIVPRNLLERIVYELSARNIPRQKFARIVLGRAQNIFMICHAHWRTGTSSVENDGNNTKR